MHRITDELYLGAFADVEQAETHGIASLLNLAERAYPHPLVQVYRAIPDEVWMAPWIWQGVIETIDELVMDHAPVLVHCRLGISRAPSAVAGFLAYSGAYPTPDAALRYIQQCRAIASPHPKTWEGLMGWWTWWNSEEPWA